MSDYIVGTVRGRKGELYTIVKKDGGRVDLKLKGNNVPKIGGDVFGLMKDGSNELSLIDNVAQYILNGKSYIGIGGSSEITARILSKMLVGSSPAQLSPGVGGIIERTPAISDENLKWVLSVLEPEANDLGIALNVVDPLSLASGEWSDVDLIDKILPADTVGEGRGLFELKALMDDGFSPSCRRTLEAIGKGLVVSSVDFVMPYSPFSTSQSFSCDLGGAYRNEVVRSPISFDDARKISSFREISLAFAYRYLGRLKYDDTYIRHIEESFADVSASLAFLRGGGDKSTVVKLARLRESALNRWSSNEVQPPATYRSLLNLLATESWVDNFSMPDILSFSASIALSSTPKNSKEMKKLVEDSKFHGDYYLDLNVATQVELDGVKKSYSSDLNRVIANLNTPKSIDRLCQFGIYTIPFGLEDVFNEEVGNFENSKTSFSL